ncbi:MAG: pyridoxamine 5'-phosphate oxidase family protein [Collinsella sp.]|nr:pyridoxamine 5'-phosphate oxidase family protein [Collinsella sp.]
MGNTVCDASCKPLVRGVLEACRTVRIGAMDEEGPFIVPLCFGYEWDEDAEGGFALTLWLHSAQTGRKVRAFSRGGADGVPVAIEMDLEEGVVPGTHACDYSLAYRSLMGVGVIAPVTNGEDKVHGLDLIMEHVAPGAPGAYGPGILDRTAIWRVEVERVSARERHLP